MTTVKLQLRVAKVEEVKGTGVAGQRKVTYEDGTEVIEMGGQAPEVGSYRDVPMSMVRTQ